ncbi:MAG: DUF484 family protein [Alphaproteobacteria bacterium]|nr:DUF484 family protein [Alphaproteobacteria bacterium]MBV9372848.1 DUF484 family protein [Alphaproteobacteria bacterium]MBV9900457.1 DUF484 family protein [Alphaproteobacteria bacterium]
MGTVTICPLSRTNSYCPHFPAGDRGTRATGGISPSLINLVRVTFPAMGKVISFEDKAVASLRARVAAAEEANQDLIAFARGHSGAVASIHEAVLAAVDAEGFDHLIHIVTQEWPQILGLDAVAVGLFVGERGLRADASGLQFVDPRMVERSLAGLEGVVLRGCERGHPLFGPACTLIRAEALVRLDTAPPLPSGLLALGQRAEQGFETRHGSELLVFLGRVLTRCMGRWLIP